MSSMLLQESHRFSSEEQRHVCVCAHASSDMLWLCAFECVWLHFVCVREKGKKSSEIRVFLSSSIIVQLLWEVLQYTAACQKDSQLLIPQHTHTHTHTDRCVSHSRTWHWVGGGEVDVEKEKEREMKAGFYSAVQPTQRASEGFVKKLSSLYISPSAVLSFSAVPWIK